MRWSARWALGAVMFALAGCQPMPGAQAPAAASAASGESAALASGAAEGGDGSTGQASSGTANKLEPLELSLASLPLEPGISTLKVPVVGGERELVVSVPEEAARPLPLVVFLHGADASEHAKGMVRCLAEPGLEQVAPIIVAPLSEKGEWWGDADAGFVLGLVKAAKRDWPVRAERVVVAGYSNGGIGAWAYARLYPEAFSAAIPMASNETVMGETTIPVFVIHGTLDEMFPFAPIQARAEQLKQAGQPVTLAARYRAKHNDACKYKEELALAGKWLTDEVWTKPRPAPPSASQTPSVN